MTRPSPNGDFQDLLTRISQGDEDACREMVERHSGRLRTAVRRRLDPRVRRLIDPLQDVWAAFFSHLRQGKTFAGPEQLLSFLLNMARNRTVEANRRFLDVQKRNVRRVVQLSAQQAAGVNAPSSRDPTPVDELIAEEWWERLILGKPSVQQSILALLRTGHTHEEVAQITGLSEKTIRRLLLRVEREAVMGVGGHSG